jgi:hypothetical protein
MEDNTIQILTEALAKTVKMVESMNSEIEKQEHRILELEKRISELGIRLDYVAIDTNADHDLNQYMQDHKDDDVFETPITAAEIFSKIDGINSRRRNL